ncbi:MAG: hypothetical protein WD096_10505 [Actinomycetota bacterium]
MLDRKRSSPLPHLGDRDPEGDAPQPGRQVTDSMLIAQGAGKGLGEGIARDIAIAREAMERPPHPVGVHPVGGLDPIAFVHIGILHRPYRAFRDPEPVGGNTRPVMQVAQSCPKGL